MGYKPMRIADIEVDRRVVAAFRAVLPVWGTLVIRRIHRNHREAQGAASSLGESAARVVIEAQDGAKTLRRLTAWLIVLTAVNTALVIYSALS
jgi:hypothetical protein